MSEAMEPAAAAGDADGLTADRNALEIAPASRFPQPLGKRAPACGSDRLSHSPHSHDDDATTQEERPPTQLIGADQSEHHQQRNLEPRASLTLRPPTRPLSAGTGEHFERNRHGHAAPLAPKPGR